MRVTNMFKSKVTSCLENEMQELDFSVIVAENVLNMKPVQICIYFIFCTFHAYCTHFNKYFTDGGRLRRKSESCRNRSCC